MWYKFNFMLFKLWTKLLHKNCYIQVELYADKIDSPSGDYLEKKITYRCITHATRDCMFVYCNKIDPVNE